MQYFEKVLSSRLVKYFHIVYIRNQLPHLVRLCFILKKFHFRLILAFEFTYVSSKKNEKRSES